MQFTQFNKKINQTVVQRRLEKTNELERFLYQMSEMQFDQTET